MPRELLLYVEAVRKRIPKVHCHPSNALKIQHGMISRTIQASFSPTTGRFGSPPSTRLTIFVLSTFSCVHTHKCAPQVHGNRSTLPYGKLYRLEEHGHWAALRHPAHQIYISSCYVRPLRLCGFNTFVCLC